ncbi:MAG: hypothetical protein ACLU93_04350 [Streptococcus sp.]
MVLLSENIYYAGNDGAFKTGWFEVDGNRYYGSDYSDDDTPKETFTQELSTHNSLAQMGNS